MQTRSSDENSVRLSIRPSVIPSVKLVISDKTKEWCVQIFIPYERSLSLVFSEKKNGWWGRASLPEILRKPTPVGAK